MDNDTRDYLDSHFKTLYERHDALKDALNGVQLQLTSKTTRHEEQLSRHDKELDVFRQRTWQLALGIITGAVSLVWHAVNTLFGGRH
jgi:hypothetical protein